MESSTGMAKHDAGGSWFFLPLGAAVVSFQAIAIVALVVTGKWGLEVPGFLLTINPVIGWVDGLNRCAIVPHSLFDSFVRSTSFHQAANVLVFATIQWIGLGLLVDLSRSKEK
jgi:hypothetical protein